MATETSRLTMSKDKVSNNADYVIVSIAQIDVHEVLSMEANELLIVRREL